MNKNVTKAIVLKRIDFGDSDRIITILTPGFGKISLMARGVRKIKSKLAGGIELFSIIDVGFLIGRSELGQLISARLDEYYPYIINDINRVTLGYDILKYFDRGIEDYTESIYFYLLCQLLRLLNQENIPLSRIDLYFKSQMLLLAGHAPNLITDQDSKELLENEKYTLSISTMGLNRSVMGTLESSHIKLMRLLFNKKDSQKIFNIITTKNEEEDIKPLIDAMFRSYLSV
jgi:DNA repair protein RecO (recombination protein O)